MQFSNTALVWFKISMSETITGITLHRTNKYPTLLKWSDSTYDHVPKHIVFFSVYLKKNDAISNRNQIEK